MPTITIRNVPDEVLKRLKALARSNNRSMEEELRVMICARVADRFSVLQQVWQSWSKQDRPTTSKEVDRWIRESRP